MTRERKGAAWLVAVSVGALLVPAAAHATTFTVTQAADATDATPNDGVCDVNTVMAGNQCSLRGAVQTAAGNGSTGADVVEAPTSLGTYNLTMGQLLASGNGNLTIRGTGGGRAVIDAANNSRILEALSLALTLENVTLSHGRTTGSVFGGALEFIGFSTLDTFTMTDSRIENSVSAGNNTTDADSGGARISTSGHVQITNSEITGNQAGDGTTASGVAGGIEVQGANPNVTISGSQITNNTAHGEAGADNQTSLGGTGGGLVVGDADADATPGIVTITNSQIDGNIAAPGTNPGTFNSGFSLSRAGAISLQGASAPPVLNVTGGTISNNRAGGGNIDSLVRTGVGGAIESVEGDPNSDLHLTGVTMSGNIAGGGQGSGTGNGAAISTQNDVTLTNSTLTQNLAGVGGVNSSGSGAAVSISVDNFPSGDHENATLTIDGSTLTQNAAGPTGSGGGGGAIAMSSDGPMTLTGSTLSGNQAGQSAGAISRFTSAAGSGVTDVIQDTTFAGNSAGISGGAIGLNTDGTFRIVRSALTGNQVSPGLFNAGGAIDASATSANAASGTLELINSTVAGNSAPKGGGINASGGSTALNVNLRFSTLAGNSAADGANLRFNGTASGGIPNFTIGGTVVAEPAGGGADCSTPTGTTNFTTSGGNVTDGASGECAIGPGPNDLTGTNPMLGALANNGGPTQTRALPVGSPAVNDVPAAVCSGITGDQRGVARPQGALCDAGAYEFVPPPPGGAPVTQPPVPKPKKCKKKPKKHSAAAAKKKCKKKRK
jgi:hypothetical protein